jgi:hypothetical protein
MPCLSARYDVNIGPLINIGILPPGGLAAATASAATSAATAAIAAPPTPTTARSFPALLDTGATGTCISPAVATSLGLTPIGMRPMISATHSVPKNVYLVDLVLPFGAASVGLANSQVMEFEPAAGSVFQVLVGRDILGKGVLNVGFDGHFSFCI